MTAKPISRSAHALIIGINRYTGPQAANLRGCRNDAIAWYQLCRRDLRIPLPGSMNRTPKTIGII